MATIHLSDEQVSEVLAPSKRYDKELYAEVVTRVKGSGTAEGNIETLFPGVKPAHVAFMLKQLKGDDETLVVDTHAAYGVCLIVRQPTPKAAPKAKAETPKPAAATKAATPAKKKPAAKKQTKKSA